MGSSTIARSMGSLTAIFSLGTLNLGWHANHELDPVDCKQVYVILSFEIQARYKGTLLGARSPEQLHKSIQRFQQAFSTIYASNM